MRKVICILALLCTVYASKQDVLDPSRNLERLVNVQKIAAEVILNSLTLFENQTKTNLEIKLDELKLQALTEIWIYINGAHTNINEFINKAKEEGKNVEECQDYAKYNLETKNENAKNDVETCIKNGNTAMENPLANVANSIEVIIIILMKSRASTQSCVMRNLYLTQATLNRISSNANGVTATATVEYTKMIINVRSCLTKITADTNTFTSNVILSTSNCIRNAVENPKSTTAAESVV
ncbi:uncharacterized protein LOC105428995 [Pogonomyrmex barbatus]|uniref:Uncharacterized protein LOC105428995 n=1 Tax=Pogonomyrmex barbatus TaxID=144034 RepID=A0A8N1S6L5_9HYME|nr:uncharacterized protein LOC105428995 [Pogonomyrmex barbatus]